MLREGIIEEIKESRLDKGISQKQLEYLCGIKQQMIARIESLETNPTLETVLKMLAPLGKTLKVVNTDGD